MQRAVFLLAMLLVGQALADSYGHNPRCSNNRLNEQSANRNNANRLFDSQNNNRGGYNCGDKTAAAAPADTGATQGPDTVFSVTDTTATQYQMVYYEGSMLSIEWTNQHGCGGNEATDPNQLNCNMVFQYMCDTATETDRGMRVVLRDGGNTQTPDEPGSYTDVSANNAARGHHESEAYYYECKTRKRNRGLFLADQNLNGDTARFTRQNPNGARSGLECPEERDYYPYFHATPWRDIALLTDNVAGMCDAPMNYIASNSQNSNQKFKCVGANPDAPTDAQLAANNQADCITATGTWKSWSWGLPPPACAQVGWSRVNHLGNSRNGQPLTWNWTMPLWDDLVNKPSAGYLQTFGSANNLVKCVFRKRYNISTDDYDPWNTNSSSNDNANQGIVSPIRNNPTVDVGADLQGLRLAINTNQFGRTFQDRSHVFYIKRRPTADPNAGTMPMVGPAAFWTGTPKIVNLNVRGKRGNIVQTYPSVEYDFVPNRLHVYAADMANTLLHIQWTGSNTHNNGDPAGDGQAGDAGQGTGGTDRHNMCQMLNKDENYPIPLDMFPSNMWSVSDCVQLGTTSDVAERTRMHWVDCALALATSGQYRRAVDAQETFDPLLNTSPASLVGGIIMRINTAGEYNYMCTRNNSFSNRSQKGVIIVGGVP